MTITSAAGIEFARELGAQLVVLARENSLNEIAAIQAAQGGGAWPGDAEPNGGDRSLRPAPLLLEVFVHGALCVAYSGQCLTSEALGGRSANRGECAQACRLPYDLIADGQQVDLGDRKYLLSPQDLASVEVLPDLVRAGVASLKIEGRLKSSEYVASITRVYRQALDAICGSMSPAPGAQSTFCASSPASPVSAFRSPLSSEVSRQTRYELEMAFSRGLYTGWFHGTDNQALVHGRFGTKRGVLLGEVARVDGETVQLRLVAPLKPGDGVVFDAGRPEDGEEGGRVYQVEPRGRETVLRFGRGDIDFRRVQAGHRVWKTSDPALERELRATFAGDKVRFQRPIALEVHGRAGEPLTVIANDGVGHVVQVESAVPLGVAQKQPLTVGRLREQLGRLGGTPFQLGAFQSRLESDVMLPVSELNRLRREAVAELDRLRAQPLRWTVTDAPVGASSLAIQTIACKQAPTTPDVPELIILVRNLAQLDAAWSAGARTLYCEFENPKHYRAAVARFRELQKDQAATAPPPAAIENQKSKIENSSIWVAPPRVFKPGEEWILQQVRSSEADGYLVRNYDHLRFFAADRKRGDYSLNVANPLAADYFLRRYGLERVTASYDLNVAQLEALLAAAPPAWFDITIHQHMPLFHMEHCLFCAFLTTGHDYHDCGRPCDTRRVELRDRVGALLPLKADAGCRNTVFNNRAQTGAEFLHRFRALGARQFRVEFVDEPANEVAHTVRRYWQLLRGEITGAEIWREMKLINQLGVTRGQLETAPQLIAKKP
jgi:putative protease